ICAISMGVLIWGGSSNLVVRPRQMVPICWKRPDHNLYGGGPPFPTDGYHPSESIHLAGRLVTRARWRAQDGSSALDLVASRRRGLAARGCVTARREAIVRRGGVRKSRRAARRARGRKDVHDGD